MLALSDEKVAARLAEFKSTLANKIVKANAELAQVSYKFKTN
jgi:5-(carboxyamino)imidazole ribonucleotide mutase